MSRRSLLAIAGAAIITSAGAAMTGLIVYPPNLLRVAANFSAKIVCSNVFLAARDEQSVLANDVQAPGHPLLRLEQVQVDRQKGIVRAGLLGLIGDGLAVYRPGTGCAAVPDGQIAAASEFQFVRRPVLTPSPDLPWPQGARAQINERLQEILAKDELAGAGMRALLLIHDGRLVAERYVAGFQRDIPLAGWSMAKTVTAVLVGLQIANHHLKLDQAGLFPARSPSDGRERITVADLLAMSSGLRFNEDYGDVSDVTRMLYLESDMVKFAREQPMEHPPGSHWSYSSGSSVLLSGIWQEVAGSAALTTPAEHLFEPLGMSSAVLEADSRGHFVGSSYMYATAQDWARFGQFLLQDGVWDERRILPAGFVEMMRSEVPTSQGVYGKGQVWLRWSDRVPQQNAASENRKLPPDTFWMRGHDGQYVAIVPSRRLVLVRLGLTPHRLGYRPQALLTEVIDTLDAIDPKARVPLQKGNHDNR